MIDYADLKVWQKAHQLTLWVYRITKEWPADERYGLTSQVRRAAVSIEANIAEGKGRKGSAEFAHFVSIALGSAAELSCELRIAVDLGYMDADSWKLWHQELEEVRRMLLGLIQKLSPVAPRLSP